MQRLGIRIAMGGLAAALLGITGVTAAATTAGAAPQQHVPGMKSINGISCATETQCLVVGASPGVGQVAVVSNGSPGAAVTVAGMVPNDVACGTGDTCTVVGTATGGSGLGAVVTVVNGVPGPVTTVAGTRVLHGLSCPTTQNQCLAVGEVANGSGQDIGVVLPITNGAPGAVTQVPNTARINAISCPTLADCQAVGAAPPPNVGTGRLGIAVRVTNGVPGAAQTLQTTERFDVACPTMTECTVVGANGVIQSMNNGAIAISAQAYDAEHLNSVACVAFANCVMVGSSSLNNIYDPARRNGTILQPIVHFLIGAVSPVDATGPSRAITCRGAYTCWAGADGVDGGDAVVLGPIGRSPAPRTMFVAPASKLGGTFSATVVRTDIGSPIVRQPVVFTVQGLLGTRTLCSAVTDRHGVATCRANFLAVALDAILAGTYQASSPGDDLYAASTGSGPLGL